MIVNFLLTIFGFILLAKGADLLVEGSSSIAKKFKVPTAIIGLTIVSIGTSLPELIITTSASIEKHADIALGNIIGSNLANLLLIIGICAIIKPLKISTFTQKYDSVFALFAAALLYGMGNTSNMISRIEGIFLLHLTVSFFIFNIREAKKRKIIVEEIEKVSMIKSIIYIVLGGIALKFGGDFVVDNCIIIAQKLHISERIISLTIVSISTSLPELITCLTAIKKDKQDLAVGNILGSQILNIIMILGLSSTISPLSYSRSYNRELLLLIETSFLFYIFPYTKKKGYISKTNGIIFFLIYIAYLIILLLY